MLTCRIFRVIFTAMLLVSSMTTAGLAADDVKGSADHPLVSRYEGATIVNYETKKFDEYSLLTGKVGDGEDGSPVGLEGRVTEIRYAIDKKRSTLEVFRNYESALTGAGFKIIFSCKNKECGGFDFSRAVHGGTMSGSDRDQRYLAAKLARPEGTAYVSLYIKKAYEIGGPTKNTVYADLHIVETADMETDKVTVNADAIGKGLDAEGHIAIYGIYFDTDSDRLKPESGQALDEIAKFMKARLNLHLLVVGHTDNQGKLDYNMDLSRRRAAAVVRSLTEEHGIDEARLTPAGVGFLAPVASNRGDAGRALNRRVELVER